MKSDDTLPVTYEPGPPAEVAIKLDETAIRRAKAKARHQAALAEARMFEQIGSKVLKIKTRTLSMLGDNVEVLGIKKIGHGKILIAGENAETAIAKLDELVEELQHKDPPCEPSVIRDYMQLRLSYNRQLMESGQAHIEADKQPSGKGDGANITIPFPAGTPMMVAVGTHSKAIDSIENSHPKE